MDDLSHAAIEAFAADGPHPDHADKLMLFGRFVGAWDVQATLFDEDGERRATGEWHFGWALEGRAVVDVLISPPRGAPAGPRLEYGSTIRFYDPELDAWQITWITPVQRAVRRLVAWPAGEEIVLEGDDEGRRLRWSFSEIRADSFLWQARVSDDGGASWRLQEQMRLLRR